MAVSDPHDSSLLPVASVPGSAQRKAEWVLVGSLAFLCLLLAGSALGLLLASKDESALGVMRAIVFRCH
ncbi:MAG: hypothetical protein CMM46_04365 [Rhodospirillaceae bacterium]|nr:hypothetical protein [Rhodospirillaceae bacterium]|tara:strand:+ start:489 stop:695 length:207 start_codon:yes stop_codon:yes gene_type:complete